GDRESDRAQKPKTHSFLLWLGDIAAKILAAIAFHRKPPRAVRMPVTNGRRSAAADEPSPAVWRAGDQEPTDWRWDAPGVAPNNLHPLPRHGQARDRSGATASWLSRWVPGREGRVAALRDESAIPH